MNAGRPDVELRAAREDELPLLSELCLRAKAVWGYEETFLDACRSELTLRPGELHTTSIRVAERDGSVVGVVQVSVTGAAADLAKLFIEPQAIGNGVGRLLFEWARAAARRHGAEYLTIDSDPDAVGFYMKMGASDCGTMPSGSIPGRMLPRLRVEL